MLIVETYDAAETRNIGRSLAAYLEPGSVVCLAGELGAGKTVFAQGVAAGLGVEEPVNSPTFTLVNEYQGRLPFYHLDLYRLESPESLYDLGYEEYFDSDGIVLIEWAERAAGFLPRELLRVEIERAGKNDGGTYRRLSFIPLGSRYENILLRMEKRCGC
ncbi:MAG: tRNA (adenosine(37)-N6)-threonylcarbamoyltransferase complex ATPase subunit type 1 TsaE [bacterium]|jgi:tRNA threonylcarbamoyladenosine biosynthesis protein TsaE